MVPTCAHYQAGQLVQRLVLPQDRKHGMCMSVQLFHHPQARARVLACVGYEDGSVGVWDTSDAREPLFLRRLHSEPVLSLNIDPSGTGVSAWVCCAWMVLHFLFAAPCWLWSGHP
jgi:hypothetical protein